MRENNGYWPVYRLIALFTAFIVQLIQTTTLQNKAHKQNNFVCRLSYIIKPMACNERQLNVLPISTNKNVTYKSLSYCYCLSYSSTLKGKFPQTTIWIGWVESNFRNPTVKFGANFDNPFKRTNYANICMPPSQDRTLPESVISQENHSPFTLYIDFQKFQFVMDMNSSVDQVQSELHAQSS